ncbi:MAG: RDD family protein [Paracoccaceae bacterium]|nr:RDD family protein [Paracoccaceae bacterium]
MPVTPSPVTTPLPDPIRHAEFYDGVATKRGLAWVVDLILTFLICLLILPFTAFTALFFWPLLFFAVNTAYRIVSLTRSSATPGMRLMAIEFRRPDGAPFDLATATEHTLAFLLSWGMVLPQVVSGVMMLLGARAQGLTDLFLGTVAINRPARR